MPRSTEKPFTVAAAQLAPVFMDREATVQKACEAIGDAARNGAKVIVFPEAFIPAYPDWVWAVPPGRADIERDMYAELLDQAVRIPGPATDALCRAAKAAGVFVAVGINELSASGGSLYNTMLYIDDRGEILGRHRKLVPTAAERLVWTPGDGSTLEVYETPYGRLGGLICWENYMPLARYALYAWGVQIYVACTWDSDDTWVATLQHIAKEGRCVVIGCCIAMRKDDIPDRYAFKSLYPADHEWINRGNSAIADANGHIVAGPVVNKEEIIYAEVDPAKLRGAKYWLDVAGHYARPDVFQLTVNRKANEIIGAAAETPANGAGKVQRKATRRIARG